MCAGVGFYAPKIHKLDMTLLREILSNYESKNDNQAGTA